MMEFDAYQPDLSPDVKVAISTDGTILATAGNGTILLFDISNPGSSREMGHVSHPHEGESVEYLWFDPNYQSPFLISGGGDGSFHVWNLRESNFTPVSPYRSIPRNHGIADIAISSKYVIVAGEDTLYISSNFNNAFTPISAVTYSDFHHGLVQTMMINSSNTRLFTAGQDGVIVEWDIADPHRIKFIKNYSGHTNRVSSTAFHPSGKFIVSGGDDSKIVIWGITQEVIPSILRSKIKTDSAITDIAYSPKLGLLAVGEEEGGITLWNISDPDAPVIDYQIPIRTPIAHVAFSPDETVFMYLSNATNAYRPTGYMRDLVRFDYSETRRLFELNTPDIFVGKNHYILAGEIGDGTLKIFQWNVDGKVNREHDPISTGACPFRNAAFTMDGAFAAIATCKVQLWNFPDVGSPSMIQEIGSPNPRGVDLSLDGSLLASANADNSISLWSIPQDRAPKLLSTKGSEHLNPVTSVTINSEKNMMASGGDDPSIIYWDITSPANPSQRFILTGHSSTILNGGTFFSADGKILISASKDEVVLWDIDSDSWMKKACSIAGRNFTQLEWNQFVGKDTPYHPTCLELPIPED
jgi:WD40 repeat protein